MKDGYLPITTDQACSGTGRLLSGTLFQIVCHLHNVNCLMKRVFVHLERNHADLYQNTLDIESMFKNKNGGINQHLVSEGLPRFKSWCETRFKSLYMNYEKLYEMRSQLQGMKDSGRFQLMNNINLPLGVAVAETLLPVYKLLCKMDTDDEHSAGDVLHSYNSLLLYCQKPSEEFLYPEHTAKIKVCLQEAICEQLFGNKVGKSKVPIRVKPPDCAAMALWPPSRLVHFNLDTQLMCISLFTYRKSIPKCVPAKFVQVATEEAEIWKKTARDFLLSLADALGLKTTSTERKRIDPFHPDCFKLFRCQDHYKAIEKEYDDYMKEGGIVVWLDSK